MFKQALSYSTYTIEFLASRIVDVIQWVFHKFLKMNGCFYNRKKTVFVTKYVN